MLTIMNFHFVVSVLLIFLYQTSSLNSVYRDAVDRNQTLYARKIANSVETLVPYRFSRSPLLKISFEFCNCSLGHTLPAVAVDQSGLFGNFSLRFSTSINYQSIPNNLSVICMNSHGLWSKAANAVSIYTSAGSANIETDNGLKQQEQKSFWSKFTTRLGTNKSISNTIDASAEFSTIFWILPRLTGAKLRNETTEIIRLGYSTSCKFNYKISLIGSGVGGNFTESSKVPLADKSFIQLKLELCRIVPISLKSIGADLYSDQFHIPSSLLASNKAFLASVAVRSSTIFFPPFFRVYQIRVDFIIVIAPTVFSADYDATLNVQVFNSSTYYFSTESIMDITSWGSTVVGEESPKSTGKIFSNSFAQILSLSAADANLLTKIPKVTNATIVQKLASKNMSVTFNENGVGIVSPFDTSGGVILYSLRIVNFVDITTDEWRYIYFCEYPLSTVLPDNAAEIVQENSVSIPENTSVEYPQGFECLPQVADLPVIAMKALVWIPTHWESFYFSTINVFQKQRVQLEIKAVKKYYEIRRCNNYFNCTIQDRIYFDGDDCTGTITKKPQGEFYSLDGTIVDIDASIFGRSTNSLLYLDQNLTQWDSSVVSFQFKYRPPYGRFTSLSTIPLESVSYTLMWNALRQSSSLHIAEEESISSSGKLSLLVQEIPKPIRPSPLTQTRSVVSRVLTLLDIKYLKDISSSGSRIQLLSSPKNGKLFCVPTSILLFLQQSGNAFLNVVYRNNTLLKSIATAKNEVTILKPYCSLSAAGENQSLQTRSLTSSQYSMYSTYVLYLYSGEEEAMQKDGLVGNDSFIYKLWQDSSIMSVHGQFDIAATSSIVIDTMRTCASSTQYKSGSLQVNETLQADITIYGNDLASLMSRPLNVNVVAKSIYGKFETINNEANLLPPYTSGVPFRYTFDPSTYRFSYPTQTFRAKSISCPYFGTESVSLKLSSLTVENAATAIATSNNSKVSAVSSSTFDLQIAIRNINDPTNILVESSKGGNSVVTSNRLEKSIFAFSGGNEELFLENITLLSFAAEKWRVLDPDCGLSPVRVRINMTSRRSVMSITQNTLSLVDFNSQTYCFHRTVSLLCRGDGQDDNDMVFVTSPLDLPVVLRSLRYYNYLPNSKDTIFISVFDGVGSECFPKILLDTDTHYSGCFVSTFSIDVKIGPWRNLGDAGKVGFFSGGSWTMNSVLQSSTRLQYAAGGLGVMLVFLVCCFRKCIRKKREKSQKMEIEHSKSAYEEKVKGNSRDKIASKIKLPSSVDKYSNAECNRRLLGTPSPDRSRRSHHQSKSRSPSPYRQHGRTVSATELLYEDNPYLPNMHHLHHNEERYATPTRHQKKNKRTKYSDTQVTQVPTQFTDVNNYDSHKKRKKSPRREVAQKSSHYNDDYDEFFEMVV